MFRGAQEILSCVLIFTILLPLTETHQGGNGANHYFLEKQKFLIEILHQVEAPLLNRQWLDVGKNLIVNRSNYVEFNKEMQEFEASLENGKLLAKTATFNLFHSGHYDQLYGLFYYFYNANDWETLLLNACWARAYAHPHMFVYAFTQALMKRCDFKHLILPEIYEILPKLFVNEASVHTALNFDYGQFSRMRFLYKDVRYWRRPNGEIYVKHQKGAKNYTKPQQRPKALADLTKLILPINEQQNDGLNELREDIAWNAFWYYQNMGLLWSNELSNSGELPVIEFWFSILSQILARYNLETLSLQKPSIKQNPTKLLYLNGRKFKTFPASAKAAALEALTKLGQQVEAALSSEVLTLSNRTVVSLRNGQNWGLLVGQLFGSNIHELYKRFFVVSNTVEQSPQMLLYFETQLRDSNFYELAEIVYAYYQKLRHNFLEAPQQPVDLAIEHVSLSKLQTFHETFHFDVSNLLTSKHFYYDGQLYWPKSLLAHQQRLQHEPFNITFNITSGKAQTLMLRSFLAAPQKPNFRFQLDAFVVDLLAGSNVVVRSSLDFYGAPQRVKVDQSILYHLTMLGLDHQYDFPLNATTAKCGFPQHLLLPFGDGHGNERLLTFLFIAAPFNHEFDDGKALDCDFACDFTRFEDFDLNFAMNGPNFYGKRVKIFQRN